RQRLRVGTDFLPGISSTPSDRSGAAAARAKTICWRRATARRSILPPRTGLFRLPFRRSRPASTAFPPIARRASPSAPSPRKSPRQPALSSASCSAALGATPQITTAPRLLNWGLSEELASKIGGREARSRHTPPQLSGSYQRYGTLGCLVICLN